MATQSTIQLSELTIDQKIGQLFFIGIRGSEVDTETAALLNEIQPGGVCLFARNIKAKSQTRALLDRIRAISTLKPFLSVDQEGGLVDRFRRIMAPAPAASKFKNVEDVIEFGRLTAETLAILGFNMNFAPVVDVIDEEREVVSNGMYSRAFGYDREEVVKLAGAFLLELATGGIIGCLKHFPGLGGAVVDSHEELPQINVDERKLNEIDLYPYRCLLKQNVEMVMVAHAAYLNVSLQEQDSDGRLLPSSLSGNFINGLLRNKLGFEGVVITDDLEMGAIVKNYGIGQACKMALNAGNDMLAICAKEEAIREGFAAVSKAVLDGKIAESRIDDSLQRIASLKSNLNATVDFDEDRLNEISEQMLKLAARLN